MQASLGYLPENLPLYPEMMVADYLDYIATLKGIAKGQRMQAVREAVTATDLGARALDAIDTLSRGLKQRVAVAQALLGRPRLLILDEPANGLDVHHTDHMRTLIRQLARRATIILSTHIMQEVEAVCDRVLVLRNGRLVLDESLQALRYTRSLQLKTCGSAADLPAYLSRLPQVSAVEADREARVGVVEPAVMAPVARSASCWLMAPARRFRIRRSRRRMVVMGETVRPVRTVGWGCREGGALQAEWRF